MREMRIYLELRFATAEDNRKAIKLLSSSESWRVADCTLLCHEIKETTLIRNVLLTDEKVKSEVATMLKAALRLLPGLPIEKAAYSVVKDGFYWYGLYDLSIGEDGKVEEKEDEQTVTWNAVLTMTYNEYRKIYEWELGKKGCDELLEWLMRKNSGSVVRYVYYVEVKLTGTAKDRDSMARGHWPDEVSVSEILSGQMRREEDIKRLFSSGPLSGEQCRKFVEDWLTEKKAFDNNKNVHKTHPWIAAVTTTDNKDGEAGQETDLTH